MDLDLAAATRVERRTSIAENPSGALMRRRERTVASATGTATNGSDNDADPMPESVLFVVVPDFATSSPCSNMMTVSMK
jgi:hypothetical protein